MSSIRAVLTVRLQDCWSNVDETWHVRSMGPGKRPLGVRILSFSLHHAGPPQT